MNIKVAVDYLIKAHNFLIENKLFYLYGLLIYLTLSIPTVFISNSFDPYGMMSLLGLVLGYFWVGYAVLLPVFIYKKTNDEKIGIPQVTKIILSNIKKIIIFSFLVVCILGLLVLLLYLFFDVFLQIKVVEQVFADTTKSHGFGFYPLKASFWALGEFIFAPLFFLPIAYVLEDWSLWASVKRSTDLAIKHRSFLFPIVALYAIYYFVCYLFIPDGNYYILPFRGIVESYFGVLIMTTVFFFYKDHYKITPHVKIANMEEQTVSTFTNIEFSAKYTYHDFYEAQRMFYEFYKAKRNNIVLGVFLVCISSIATFYDFNLTNMIVMAIGLSLIFLRKPYLRVVAYLMYKIIRRFYGTTKILIDEYGVKTENRRSTSYVKWKSFKKYLYNSKLLLLWRQVPFVPLFMFVTPIPRRYIDEKDWERLTALINDKVGIKEQLKEPNRFVRWSIFGLLILFAELNFFLGCVLLATYFKFDQQTIQRSTYIYIGVAAAIPFLFYILKLHKRFLRRNLAIAIVVFLAISISFSFIPNQEKPKAEEVKHEFSSDQLWKAVNDKRVQYGVQRLEKNKWACKVAEIRLADNLKVGNGYYASEDGYSIAIQKVIGEYEKVDVIEKKEAMPEFASQYTFNARNLNAGMQLLIDEKSNKELFMDRDLTYGCAAARRGYGVIVTASDPLYDPKEEPENKKSSYPTELDNVDGTFLSI